MFAFLRNLFGGSTSHNFSVELSSRRPGRTQSDEISDLDIPSSEKITHVEIQNIPISGAEVIEAERSSKRYTLSVVPQRKNSFEFDRSKKVIVFVLAGSKDEAMNALSQKLSGTYPYSDDSNSNTAEAGRWYDGNKYAMEILRFEKNTM